MKKMAQSSRVARPSLARFSLKNDEKPISRQSLPFEKKNMCASEARNLKLSKTKTRQKELPDFVRGKIRGDNFNNYHR